MENNELLQQVTAKAEKWLTGAYNEEAKAEVRRMLDAEDKTELIECFYRDLEFGTGGLRGVIGAGTNRINVYTVGQATQGLADYLNEAFENPSVAIAYDSRIKSDVLAKTAAGVLAANGIKVYIYPELMPTPMLSFAVRRLHCSSGIVLTASHNPAKYNGYKCYDSKGYQMTDEAAAKTYEYMKKVDMFTGVKRMDFEDALAEDMVDFIEDWVKDEFIENVAAYQNENDEYHYLFNSDHGLLSLEESFKAIFNSGQTWKFNDMKLLKIANDNFYENIVEDTNLGIIQKYFDLIENKEDIEIIKLTELPIADRYSTGTSLSKHDIFDVFVEKILENPKEQKKEEPKEIVKENISLESIDQRMMTIDDFLGDLDKGIE